MNWLNINIFEIPIYILTTLISVLFCYEVSKKFSNRVCKLITAVLCSIAGTFIVFLTNNIIRYFSDLYLYARVMEWTIWDILLRDLEYAFLGGVGLYRYLGCFLLLLSLSITIMFLGSTEGKRLVKRSIYKREVHKFMHDIKHFGGFFNFVIIDCPPGDISFDKEHYFIEKLRSIIPQGISIISSESFRDYLYALLRNNNDSCTSVTQRLGDDKEYIVIQDIDIALEGSLLAQKLAFDVLKSNLKHDRKSVIIVTGNIKEKAPEFYRDVELFKSGFVIE